MRAAASGPSVPIEVGTPAERGCVQQHGLPVDAAQRHASHQRHPRIITRRRDDNDSVGAAEAPLLNDQQFDSGTPRTGRTEGLLQGSSEGDGCRDRGSQVRPWDASTLRYRVLRSVT